MHPSSSPPPHCWPWLRSSPATSPPAAPRASTRPTPCATNERDRPCAIRGLSTPRFAWSVRAGGVPTGLPNPITANHSAYPTNVPPRSASRHSLPLAAAQPGNGTTITGTRRRRHYWLTQAAFPILNPARLPRRPYLGSVPDCWCHGLLSPAIKAPILLAT